jgi:nucleoside-diphosphate-sugar epimerase
MSTDLEAFRSVNVGVSEALARAAVEVGVKRFVFVSSLKVHGESTKPGSPFSALSPLLPEDAYGRSKAEAEEGLAKITSGTSTELVVIRPPLVHGQGVKGNLASVIRALRRGLPLPLGDAKRNRRSLVGVDNLVDLLLHCALSLAIGNQRFLVSDDCDVSTVTLLESIGKALGRAPLLVNVPERLIQSVATLSMRRHLFERLFGSLQVDMEHTKRHLHWTPKVSFEEGIRRMVAPEGKSP